jgi:hypothetical protein
MTLPTTSQRPGGAALTLLELNELNFDLVRRYVERDPRELPNFARLLKMESRETSSEDTYETLEPWIQWVSAHSGLTAKEHGVHRLGDAVRTDVPQLLGTLEQQGLKVGAVSPMNMPNQLTRPAYFIPDPWTQTPTDGSLWSVKIWRAISQAVNDNAQGRIERSTLFWLGLAFVRFARFRRLKLYASLALRSKGAPWRKALFLDLFLNDVHTGLLRAGRPDLSVLFLNAGAHIQHHYLFNAKALASRPLANPSWYVAEEEDPFGEMLKVYDVILGDHLDTRRDLIAATGLSQVPYDRVKFYYRLKDHAAFLRRLGLPFKEVLPLMTRDFLIAFADSAQADRAQEVLSQIRSVSDDLPIFGEIDHRGTSLFVTLTYPNEIASGFKARAPDGQELNLHEKVAFVAIKNGMHSGRGFAFFRGHVSSLAPAHGAHVKSLHNVVLQHFGLGGRVSRVAGGEAG